MRCLGSVSVEAWGETALIHDFKRESFLEKRKEMRKNRVRMWPQVKSSLLLMHKLHSKVGLPSGNFRLGFRTFCTYMHQALDMRGREGLTFQGSFPQLGECCGEGKVLSTANSWRMSEPVRKRDRWGQKQSLPEEASKYCSRKCNSKRREIQEHESAPCGHRE